MGKNTKIKNLRNTKKLVSFVELIFYIGVFLMPFDNLVFAPSAGWAAIAPFAFFLYVFLNLRYLRIKPLHLVWAIFIIILSSFCYVFYNPAISAVIDTASTIFLGLSFYFSLYIHFIVKENNPKLFLKILVLAYFISFLYGLAYLTGIDAIENLMKAIEKRHSGRLQYTFTEPSFTSMHLFGVILPCIIIFKQRETEVFALKILLALFVLVTCIFGSSTRFILDTAIVVCIYFACRFFRSGINLKKIAIIVIGVVGIILAFKIVKNNPRLSKVLEKGIYADDSLAARWFRINAIIKGMIERPLSFFSGFGLGNASIPFNIGYDAAFLEYKSEYLVEIQSIKGTRGTSFFCGHIRVISEVGLVLYLALIIALFRTKNKKFRNWFFILLTFYLYVQFDSYAFYTIWLFVFNKTYKCGEFNLNFSTNKKHVKK